MTNIDLAPNRACKKNCPYKQVEKQLYKNIYHCTKYDVNLMVQIYERTGHYRIYKNWKCIKDGKKK